MVKFTRQRGLFGGYEPQPRDPRGRKRIAWCQQTAEKIVVLAAQEATQEAIAQAVGLSVKTLVRIYAGELAEAATTLRQAVFEAQVRRATEKGSTPAAKFVLAVLDKEDLRPRARRRPAPDSITPPARLGKKDQAQLDATTAHEGTTWAKRLQ